MSPATQAKPRPQAQQGNGKPAGAASKEESVRRAILDKVSSGELDPDAAFKALGELDDARPKSRLYAKVSAKKAVSVYGLQRMPVTLYVEQWERLLAFADELRQFLKDHDRELSRKVREAK